MALSKINSKPLKGIKLESLKFESRYLMSLFLFSSENAMSLTKNNFCSLSDLVINHLLRSHNKINDFVILAEGSGENQNIYNLTLEEFKNFVLKEKCPSVHSKLKFFNSRSITSLLRTLNFEIPRTEKECSELHLKWKTNKYLPNLCSLTNIDEQVQFLTIQKNELSSVDVKGLQNLNQKISELKSLKSEIGTQTDNYLNNLCRNISNEKGFCKSYISPLVWNKVVMGEKPKWLMSYRCKELNGVRSLNQCRSELVSKPEVCMNDALLDYPSLAPRNNCTIQSFLLNSSRLKTDYRDCPGFIDNGAIINIHRLNSHFAELSGEKFNDCQSFALENFAKLNLNYKNDNAWPMKICYFDKIENKRLCKSYIPGDRDPEIAETNVVAKIIKRIAPSPNKLDCKIVSASQYNPQRLGFTTGCFIIFDDKNCTLQSCQRKVVLDQKEVKGIEYEGDFKIHYFDDGFINPKYSQTRVLFESKGISHKRIPNFTLMQSFLEKNKNGVIHGIGCLETLLPGFFPSQRLNACTPEPFIIDNVLERKGIKFVSLRLSMDDAHSPRLIWWQNVFHSLSLFEKIHPSRTWTLYGARIERN